MICVLIMCIYIYDYKRDGVTSPLTYVGEKDVPRYATGDVCLVMSSAVVFVGILTDSVYLGNGCCISLKTNVLPCATA